MLFITIIISLFCVISFAGNHNQNLQQIVLPPSIGKVTP